MTDIRDLILKKGPSLSSEIADIIIKNDNIERNTAQKRINRAINRSDIHASLCITFKNNTKFIYLKEQFDTKSYWKRLLSLLRRNSHSFYYIIMAIHANGGIASRGELMCFSAAPDLMKGKIKFENVLYNLAQSKIIEPIELNSEEHYQLNKYLSAVSISLNNYLANKMAKEAILIYLKKWLVLNNFSYEKSLQDIDEEKTFFHYYWHIYSMSYSFNGISNKDVFLPVDIIMNNYVLYEDNIHFFMAKIRAIRKFKKAPDFVPFLIANFFDKNTLMMLKKQKVIATTPKNLFGNDFADLLKILVDTLSDIKTAVKKYPDKLYDTIRKMQKSIGVSFNMKGKLFEYFIANYVYIETHHRFEVGKIIRDPISYGQAEIDVICYKPKKAVDIYECKAYDKNMIDFDDLKDWKKKRNRINNWIKSQEDLSPDDINYYYISLSGFTDEAINLNVSDYANCHLMDKEDLRLKIDQSKDKDLINTFNEFFN